MKKILSLILLVFGCCLQAQNMQSISGTWALAKVVKIERMPASEIRKAKEMLEGNVLLTFNQDGSFKSTADSKKELREWIYQKKTRTITLKGKQLRLKIKILKFKPEQMRVKMQLSKSVLGEFVLVKK